MNATTTSIEKQSSSLLGTKQSQQLACPEQGRRVPKLRFKEFDGELTNCKLDDIVTFKSGGTPSKEKDTYWNGNIPWISAASMSGKYYSKSERTITEEGLENGSKLALKGSLLLLVRGSMLFNKIPIGIAERDVAFNQDLKSLIPNEKSYNEFLYQWFSAKQNYLLHKVTGTGIGAGKLDTDDLKSSKLVLPTLPEQQKIASFLSAVDEKIQQLSKKKALLEDYKKGVMQQLFSQKLRFKDENGMDYPEWEEKKFGDLYSFYSTNSLSRDKLNYESGTVYNIHYGDIHTKFKTAFNLTEEYIPFVNDDVDLSKIKLDSYCKNGDIVMVDASEDYADIGKSIEIIDLNDKKVLAGLHTFLARPTTSETAIGFFSFLLKSWSMRKQIMVIAQGSKVLSLSTGRVGKLKLRLPCLEEQQKIATYLSSIDTKIESVASARSATEQFKKGLLQQMFV